MGDDRLHLPEWLSPGSNRRVVSTTYIVAAWLGVLAGVFVWPAFAIAALALYVAGIALRRQGL